ncbi:MAG: 50S ribosomal protein L35 [Patescibacteria group bacterium]
MKKNKVVKKKIRKSIDNRFKITSTGKVIARGSFASHLKRKKTRKQIRRMKRKHPLIGSLAIKVKKMMGAGK